MKKLNPVTVWKNVLGAIVFLASWQASASVFEVSFATEDWFNQSTGNSGWVSALDDLGISPGAITGSFLYDAATPGSVNSNNTNYNGTVSSLSFQIGGWFSESLVVPGNSGDIRIWNDITGQGDRDQLRLRVNTNAFAYAFTDTAGTLWELDRFDLFLRESSLIPDPFSDASLPTQWALDEWEVARIDLRFDPSGINGNNGIIRADLNQLAVVPEPGTLALTGLALAGFGFYRRRASALSHHFKI